jgi:cephalosporin hydroxylase
MTFPKLDLSIGAVTKYLKDHIDDAPRAARFFEYVKTQRFEDDFGLVFDPGRMVIMHVQAAALFYLTRTLRADVTIETGFGGGGSAGVIISAKENFSHQFHFSIDPSASIVDNIVYRHLAANFSKEFLLVREFSELALPRLANEYRHQVKLGFVDGGHHFDTALLDMIYFDRMLAFGGVIVVDDVLAPAVETACNYWRANRPDYQAFDTLPNTAIFQKILPSDARPWNHFRPFVVPNRSDWDCRRPT